MATYGVDYYGKAYYGAPVALSYAVRNLAATQLDFGRVKVSWTAPVQNIWTQLALVRSRYGYPATVLDGQLLATYSSTQASTAYDDVGLTPGYWYYGIFAAVPLATWSANLTYQVGDRVSYSAQNWVALAISPAGTTPGTGSFWEVIEQTEIWQPAGAVETLAVADHGYSAAMFGYIPDAYKAAPVLTTDDTAVNNDLADFVSVLAFGFEIAGTELDDLYHLYDTSTTRYDRLLQISNMVGISTEQASSPRYQRLRTAQAATLGRAKGTQTGLAALISAATGLECTVSTGPNLMLSRNQSDFPYPLWPAWQTTESYSVGNTVEYLGNRYVCIPWALTLPTAQYTGTPGGTSSGTTSGLAWSGVLTTSGPSQLVGFFNAPFTGVYLITFTLLFGQNNAVVSVAVDNGPITFVTAANIPALNVTATGFSPTPSGDALTSVDTYSMSSTTASYGFAVNLTAGTHFIEFNGNTKNGASGGYNIQVSTTVTAESQVYPPNTTPPAAPAANTGSQWNTPGTYTFHDYDNPISGQLSTWTATSPLTLGASYFGAVGLSMDTTWLTASGASVNGVYTLSSAEAAQITAYNNAVTYKLGNIVTATTGLQYTAIATTVGNPPPNNAYWKRSAYQSPYDRELIAQSAMPVHGPGAYDPQTAYAAGEFATYNAGLYVTPNGSTGVTPPASPGSDSGWEYWGPAAARVLTASLYVPHPQTGYDLAYPGIAFYDANGQPITAPSMMSSAGVVATALPIYARLTEPVSELNSRLTDTQLASWTANPTGFWQISSGACAGSPGYSGSQKIKFLSLSAGLSDGNVGATFVTDVANKAVRDVGILFRYSDATHYWAAFRDQLVTNNGGTVTDQYSYTRQPVGTRMFVDLLGAVIKVYAYPGGSAAPVLLATVNNGYNQTATVHGLIDWTW